MSDFGGASPPTKTSLASWWRQFKVKQQGHQTDDELDRPYPSRRPNLRHMSHSSGHVNTVGAAKNDGPDIPADVRASPIFGVDLNRSIQYANVSISLSDPSGEQFIYGYIPIVVAKCGVYLKKNATSVAGIFRLSGSARRIKDLQTTFNTPPKFGKGLDWSGYNVHDAANVFRRYLNNLPEPIIPLQFYEQFREPLRAYPSIVEYLDQQARSATCSSLALDIKSDEDKPDDDKSVEGDVDDSGLPTEQNEVSQISLKNEESPKKEDSFKKEESEDSPVDQKNEAPDEPTPSKKPEVKVEPGTQLYDDINAAVDRYQLLISQLPPLNRQLLMYILDLLSIFAAKSEENLMPAANMAAIFQPSVLSHPTHDMAPDEYPLSRAVVEFLIQHSNKFLSHIESIAIQEHERKKALRLEGVQGDGKDAHHRHGHLYVPRRKHSKSLSSVGVPDSVGQLIPPPPLAARGLSIETSDPTSPASKPRSASDQRDSPIFSSAVEAPDGHHGGFLSNLRHSVSFSRKLSPQTRSVSGSSTSSSMSRAFKTKAGSPSEEQDSPFTSAAGNLPSITTQKVPENAEVNDDTGSGELAGTESSRSRSALSGLLSRRSKSPTNSETRQHGFPYDNNLNLGVSNLSIDQALATSPPLSVNSLEVNHMTSSPRFKPFSAVFSGHHNNESSSSLNKTLSESSLGDYSDEEMSRRDEVASFPRKNISKWRRSLLIFGTNSGESNSDLLASDGLSPSSSTGIAHSPSKQNWFRKIANKTPNEVGDDRREILERTLERPEERPLQEQPIQEQPIHEPHEQPLNEQSPEVQPPQYPPPTQS